MRKELEKSYDIMMQLQNRFDSRAHVFIVFYGVTLTYAFTYVLPIISERNLLGYRSIEFCLLIAMMLLIISLVPIYNVNFLQMIIKSKGTVKVNDINIYYYKSVSRLSSTLKFQETLLDVFNWNKLSESEKQLSAQIKANADILQWKTLLHNSSFILIGELLMLTCVLLAMKIFGVTNFETATSALTALGIFILLNSMLVFSRKRKDS